MLQRILNLCAPLQNGVPADSRGYELSLEYMRHKGTIDQRARQHKRLDPTTLPNGGGFAREHVRRSSDNGTQSTRRVAAVRHVRRRRRNGSSARISTWISGGLRTDRPSPQLTCKKRWSASSIRLIRLTSSSSTPVNALACPTTLSPRAGWGGGQPLSYLASRPVRVAGTDAWFWDGHDTTMAPRFATAGVVWHGEGYRGATEIALARLISKRARLAVFKFRTFR
jgi:hypothetical protein